MLAVAILGSVSIGVFRAQVDARLASLQVPDEARQLIHKEARRLTDVPLPSAASPQVHQAMQEAVSQSFVMSFRASSLIAAALALLSAALALLTIDPRSAAPAPSGAQRSLST
jgi:hypothetical protein